jgi:hypothetical protein
MKNYDTSFLNNLSAVKERERDSLQPIHHNARNSMFVGSSSPHIRAKRGSQLSVLEKIPHKLSTYDGGDEDTNSRPSLRQ